MQTTISTATTNRSTNSITIEPIASTQIQATKPMSTATTKRLTTLITTKPITSTKKQTAMSTATTSRPINSVTTKPLASTKVQTTRPATTNRLTTTITQITSTAQSTTLTKIHSIPTAQLLSFQTTLNKSPEVTQITSTTYGAIQITPIAQLMSTNKTLSSYQNTSAVTSAVTSIVTKILTALEQNSSALSTDLSKTSRVKYDNSLFPASLAEVHIITKRITGFVANEHSTTIFPPNLSSSILPLNSARISHVDDKTSSEPTITTWIHTNLVTSNLSITAKYTHSSQEVLLGELGYTRNVIR